MFSGSKSTSRDNKTVGCRKSALDAHTIAQSHDITRTHLQTRKPQISCYSPTTRIWIVRRDLLFMQKWWWLRRNCWCQALPWYSNGSPLNHVQYVLITFGPESASSMGKKSGDTCLPTPFNSSLKLEDGIENPLGHYFDTSNDAHCGHRCEAGKPSQVHLTTGLLPHAQGPFTNSSFQFALQTFLTLVQFWNILESGTEPREEQKCVFPCFSVSLCRPERSRWKLLQAVLEVLQHLTLQQALSTKSSGVWCPFRKASQAPAPLEHWEQVSWQWTPPPKCCLPTDCRTGRALELPCAKLKDTAPRSEEATDSPRFRLGNTTSKILGTKNDQWPLDTNHINLRMPFKTNLAPYVLTFRHPPKFFYLHSHEYYIVHQYIINLSACSFCVAYLSPPTGLSMSIYNCLWLYSSLHSPWFVCRHLSASSTSVCIYLHRSSSTSTFI